MISTIGNKLVNLQGLRYMPSHAGLCHASSSWRRQCPWWRRYCQVDF